MSTLNLSPAKPSLSQVENAFLPAREVNDPDKFAGRKDAVQTAYYGLLSDGAHLAIVGNRGIGKTSLSRQVLNLARGDNELLQKLELAFDRKLDFLPVYYTCGNSTQDVDSLLNSLLSSKACLAEWVYEIPTATKHSGGIAPKIGANILGVELGVSGEKKNEVSATSAVTQHSVSEIFANVVHEIVKLELAKDGILIVIDEFDQIKDPSGFAPFLKALATNVPKVKFCLVGVAQDIQNLMKEHASSDRLFAGAVVVLPSMNTAELNEIVTIAERAVDGYITFDQGARERMIGLAQGHPYMVHLIGKYALRDAHRDDVRVINDATINVTMEQIAERQSDPVLEGRYKKAVASSEQRETVLKAFAEFQSQTQDGEVWTTNAYKLALDHGVDNASQYVGQLVTGEYGGEIERVRERYYRFHDSLFAAYVRARPRLVTKV